MALIHSSYYRPTIMPEVMSGATSNIDRLQDLSAAVTLNRSKIKEIGRDGTVAFKKGIPSVTVSLRQLEYGSLEFWQKVTNVSGTSITLNDFKTARFGIAGYKTDDNGAFLGTIWYPGLRTSSFALNIGDPDALAERSFECIGEDEITLLDDGKYLIALEDTYNTGDTTTVIGSGAYTTYPDPVEDPDNSGQYLLRVVRVRAGESEVMNYAASNTVEYDYEYNNGTKTFEPYLPAAGDIYKLYYAASTYISGGNPFTENDVDLAGISADSFSIYLGTSDYVYRLQSVAIDVSFDRQDVKEIGNSEVVARGIREKTVTVTLGRILDTYTIEEVLRGVGGLDFGKIDVRNFEDDTTLTVKCYSDKTKDVFKLGYKFTGLSPTGLNTATPTSDYVTRQASLTGEVALITSVEGAL